MLNWLYPVTCRICGEAAERALCDACLAAMPAVPLPICLYCGSPVDGQQADAFHCPACAAKPRPFDFARSAWITSDEVMPLVHDFKYRKAAYLGAAFAGALMQLWQQTPELEAYRDAALVPVPIHKHHLIKRGYNQAAELAVPLAEWLGLPVVSPLQRLHTRVDSQTRLSASERLKNAQAAYQVSASYQNGKKSLPPRLVIIDDVYTTGATLRACAAALKKLPAVQHVAALSLVRAYKKRV